MYQNDAVTQSGYRLFVCDLHLFRFIGGLLQIPLLLSCCGLVCLSVSSTAVSVVYVKYLNA